MTADPYDVPETSAPTYCGQCGLPLAERDHSPCERLLALEPPRFCTRCGRRMKVQVTPRGWSAICVEHGTISR
jgi:hypothetical protein